MNLPIDSRDANWHAANEKHGSKSRDDSLIYKHASLYKLLYISLIPGSLVYSSFFGFATFATLVSFHV